MLLPGAQKGRHLTLAGRQEGKIQFRLAHLCVLDSSLEAGAQIDDGEFRLALFGVKGDQSGDGELLVLEDSHQFLAEQRGGAYHRHPVPFFPRFHAA